VVADCNAGQAGAITEHPVPDAGDAVGIVTWSVAATERILPDAGNAGADRDVLGWGIEEGFHPDTGDAVGDRYVGQTGAA